jgi:hypothetical protein
LQRRHLGECIGFYTSETGPIEQVVQIFGYVDWNEREKKRAALWADVRFTAMSAELHPLIQSKESQILRAVDFRSSTILNRQADGLVLAAAPSEANQGKQKQRGE